MPDPSSMAGGIHQDVKDTSTIVENALRSIAQSVADAFDAAATSSDGFAKTLERDIKKSMNSLARVSDVLMKNQEKLNIGALKEKEIRDQILKREATLQAIEIQKEIAIREGIANATEMNAEYGKAVQFNQEIIERLKQQIGITKKIEYNMGILGDVMRGIAKIPFLKDLVDAEHIVAKMQKKAAQEGATRFGVLGVGARELGKQLLKNVADPLFVITELLKHGLNADKQTTQFEKSLVVSYRQAKNIRSEFAHMSMNIGDAFVTTNRLVEANGKLSKTLEINKVYSRDMLVQFVDLTKKMGLSDEAAAKLAQYSTLTSKTLKLTKLEVLQATQAISSQYDIQLDNKEIIEEVAKLSGQILANFKGDPVELAKAVATAKMFGTTLEKARQQSEYLLDFQSSIESELKAELLLGQQLNYEKARAAALQGDFVQAMKELNSQGITWDKFTHMNVLQQKAIAESMGTTSDELSNQLMKQAFLNKSREEVVALGGEEVAKRMEAMSVQDKFNAAVEKLQDLLGNLLAGPVGGLLNAFSNLASHTTTIHVLFGAIAALIGTRMILGLAKMVMQLGTALSLSMGRAAAEVTAAEALTMGTATFGILAGVGAVMGLLSSFKSKADDMVAPGYGKRVLVGPEGAISLNDKDTVLAGTSLFDRKDDKNKPEDGKMINTTIDMTPLVAAINEVKKSVDRLYNKDTALYMDSKKVGTTLVQGSSKLA